MKQFALIVAAMLVLSGLAAEPAKALVTVVPAHPTTSDSVKVTIRSGFAERCWALGQLDCRALQPDTLSMTIPANFCGGAPSCDCLQQPIEYVRTCNFGRLLPGTYVASFTELHPNPFDPTHTFTQMVQFSVDDATPTARRSWGTLKSIYR